MDFRNILTGVPGYVMTGWVDAQPVLLHDIEAKMWNCACHPAASFHVSHTVGYKHGLLWLFSQDEVPLWLLHHSLSPMGYWPSDHDSHWALSVILTSDRMRLWPWHPRSKRAHAGIHLPLNVHSLRLFPEFLRDSWFPWDFFFHSCSISFRILPSPAWMALAFRLCMLTDTTKYTERCNFLTWLTIPNVHVMLMLVGPQINFQNLTLSQHSDKEFSYCRGSLQAKVEGADQGSSPAG